MYNGFPPSVEDQRTPRFEDLRFNGLRSVEYETIAIQPVQETHTFGYKRNVSGYTVNHLAA